MLYGWRTPEAVVQALGEFDEEDPYLVVVIGGIEMKAASDEVAAGVLRHLRACSDFLEWTGERRSPYLPDGVHWVRVFAARAQRAAPGTWGAVLDDWPQLRVDANDDPGEDDRKIAATNALRYLPSPLPEGWQTLDAPAADETKCGLEVPGAKMVLSVVKDLDGEISLGVVLVPRGPGAPVLGDEAARALLTPLRRRGAFEEQATIENPRTPGARTFVAGVG